MKAALIGTAIGLVVALVAITSSCSINHRSDQYACEKNTDCGDGQVDFPEVCDDGAANGTSASCCTTTCTALPNQ